MSKTAPIFQHDNLDILRGINSDTVDLIATDPPFNKGRDFHATPDSIASGASFQDRWRWTDLHDGWRDELRDDPHGAGVIDAVDFAKATYGEDMSAFLAFIGARLLEMHRILKPTGSIYLHCDPTASHYLKAADGCGVSGVKQFRNEISVVHTASGQTQPQSDGFRRSTISFCSTPKALTCARSTSSTAR